MSIQQLASGSSNGIMNFLFHDDGSGTEDDMVLEGADFSKALHQLLGEFETEGAATPNATASVTAETEATETSVSAGKLASDAKASIATLQPGIPAHADGNVPQLDAKASAPAQPQVQPQAETVVAYPLGAELDMLADDAAVTADPAQTPDKDEVPTSFGHGINHLIELVREATQVSPQPAAQTALQQGGKPAPPSGKTLPPEIRATGPKHGKPDDIQPRAVLTPEFFQFPDNLRQQAMTSAAEPPVNTVRADGRVVQLPSARKLQQSIRAGFTAGQRTPAPDAESRTAAGSPAQAVDIGDRLLAQGVAVDAQSVAANTSTNNAQTHGMHGQNAPTPLHALTPKTSAPDTGTTFANPQLYSPHPMGSDAWMQDLGTRVEWLKDMNVSTADLRLHPAELGTLEIRIMTDNDNTTVSFITHNSAARDIIESSLPQLRELLASQGMQLGHSQVSHQSAEGQRRGHEANFAQPMLQRNNDSAEDAPLPPRRVSYVADPGRIDHYV